MIIDDSIYISFMCPACGNYFYGSNVRSYNTVGATVFSDGYSRSYYNPFWLTRCPRCKQYFSKKHLLNCRKVYVYSRKVHIFHAKQLKSLKMTSFLEGSTDILMKVKPKRNLLKKQLHKEYIFP